MRRERMLGFSAVVALSMLVVHGVAAGQADRASVVEHSGCGILNSMTSGTQANTRASILTLKWSHGVTQTMTRNDLHSTVRHMPAQPI